jgi:tetratricopeptide (TPR) repeat protein
MKRNSAHSMRCLCITLCIPCCVFLTSCVPFGIFAIHSAAPQNSTEQALDIYLALACFLPAILFTFLSSSLAQRKGRNPWVWSILSLFFSFLSYCVLYNLDDLSQPIEKKHSVASEMSYDHAIELFGQGKFREALPVLEETAKLNPSSASVYFSLAATYSKIAGEYVNDEEKIEQLAKKARDCFKKSLELARTLGGLDDKQVMIARDFVAAFERFKKPEGRVVSEKKSPRVQPRGPSMSGAVEPFQGISPQLRGELKRAVNVSKECIGIMEKCRSSEEVLTGFRRCRLLLSSINHPLAQAIDMTLGAAPVLDEAHIHGLKDRFLKNQRAFVAVVEKDG